MAVKPDSANRVQKALIVGLSICKRIVRSLALTRKLVRSQEFEDTGLLFVARRKKERKQALREFEGSASVLVRFPSIEVRLVQLKSGVGDLTGAEITCLKRPAQ
jgi:hypothetical protein